MSLKFYNTLKREKEEFKPLNPLEVTFYSCGPTVYNYPHIGNYRSFIFADILKRVLIYQGYNVKHIMNLTDIDDKTILNSQKEGKSLKEFTEFYTEVFLKDIKSLNILNPSKFTKATDYIDQMVNIIKKLMDKGLAYKSADGSVYFDIKKFPNYGKLSHLVIENQKENASGRIMTDEYEKDNVQDFALWKAWDEKDGEVFWDPSTTLGAGTVLGKGRPGWHIECSAMSMANLGEQIDIHTGGVDNIFPHHENEIAQSEGATGKQFVKYWMHNEWVLVDQKKMSKSANNFYTLRDVLDKGINPLAYRLWLLTANYRTRVNFTWEVLGGLETALKRLYRAYLDLGNEVGTVSKEYEQKFKAFVEDDLDTPQALALVWDLVKDGGISNKDKKATLLNFDKVLGLGLATVREPRVFHMTAETGRYSVGGMDVDFDYVKKEIPEEIIKLVEEREQARKNKDWKKSDEIRGQTGAAGYNIKDTSEGPNVTKI